jgi:DNA-binding MurR/RpiR family transcriptional regulator
MFEQIYRLKEDDVVIGISFPRYSKRTLKAMEFAKARKAGVITITDSLLSPMIQFADCSLIARSDMASFVDSLVAPLSLINALIVALCMKKKDVVVEALGNLESIWTEYQVYDNSDDMNIGYNLNINSEKI